jgi:hypothetical protein
MNDRKFCKQSEREEEGEAERRTGRKERREDWRE